MRVTLLGPQRRPAAARAAVAELMPSGPIAAINAGWLERESDADELNDVLGGRMTNLELYARWRSLLSADPDYAAAERRLRDLLDEQQALYGVRLGSAMTALEALTRRAEVPRLQADAVADAVGAVRALDRWHLRTVAALRQGFYEEVRLGEHSGVAQHREQIAAVAADAAGFVFTGGHVGYLLHLLHVFGLAALVREPVIAWSAGAMALSGAVVLYDDFAAAGPGPAEVYADGLAAFDKVVCFPHPRRRLQLGDEGRMGLLAARFAPACCVLLADDERVDLRPGEPLPDGARVLAAIA